MDTIAGLKGTGRRLRGPGFDLMELLDDQGLKHTSAVIEPMYRDHSSLHADLEFGIGFMEQPEVTGLCRLVRHSPEEGAFVYPTGTVWSVAEIVRELAATGDTGGVKAGLELCYMAGEILVEAADQSSHSGLACHGSIDPWKLLIKPDGQLSILGYGLPRTSVELYKADETAVPSEDTLRYCSPEDLREDATPDISADLFSVSLIALELMVGKPVYDGMIADIKQQATRAEAARRLYQWRDRLPTAVREVLGKALKPDPDIRFRDGLDFVYGIHDLLGGIDAGDGPSLRELVTQVRARQKRGVAVVGGNTGALTAAELRELAADIDNAGVSTDLASPRRPRPVAELKAEDRPRWQPASRNVRSRGRAAPDDGEVTPAPRARAARRSDRTKSAEPTAPRASRRGRRGAPPEESGDGGDSARDRLLRRLRDRGQPSGEELAPAKKTPSKQTPTARPEETTLPPPTTKTGPLKGKRRRRPGGRAAALLERLRSTSGESIPEPTPPEPTPPAAEPPSKPIAPPASNPVRSSESRTSGKSTTVAASPKSASSRAAARAPASTGGLPEVQVKFQDRSLSLVRGSDSASTLASVAAERLGLSAVDLFGTIRCAWRLGVEEGPLRPDLHGEDLPDDAVLLAVANAPRTIDVRFEDRQTRLVVGEAVTFADLAKALGARFAVDGPVTLVAEHTELSDNGILADHPGLGQLELRP